MVVVTLFNLIELVVLVHSKISYCGSFFYLSRCLIICFNTRAVRIGLIHGLDADVCMMAIMRFMARRGRPHAHDHQWPTSWVLLLNARNWPRNRITQPFATVWHITVWSGSSVFPGHLALLLYGKNWFAVVRKRIFFLEPTGLTLPVLSITMCLVEQTLNGQPIIFVSDDPGDLEALTPNHFHLGRKVAAQPLLPDAATYVDCRKLYKEAQSFKAPMR